MRNKTSKYTLIKNKGYMHYMHITCTDMYTPLSTHLLCYSVTNIYSHRGRAITFTQLRESKQL